MQNPSGNGDIVIGDAPKKKSRKGLVIGVIMAVVVLVVGVVVAMILMNGGQKNETARDKFNKLMNYVVSGEDSTLDVTEKYDSTRQYYIETASAVNSYAKVDELLASASSAFEKTYSGNEELVDKIGVAKQTFDFVRVISIKQIPSNIQIIHEYITAGEKATRAYFANYYDFSDVNSSRVETFTKIFGNYVDAEITILNLFRDNGCIIDGDIDYTCMQDKNDTDLAKELNTQKNRNKTAYATMEWYLNLGENFIEQLFEINEIVGSI